MFGLTYPYIKDNRLLASGLDTDLEFSRSNLPPNGDAGGAGQYKYWMDTSTNPATLRMCTAPRATAGLYVASEWIKLATVDVVNNVFQFDSTTVNVSTPPPVSNNNSIATTAYVQEKVSHYLPLTGGTLSGPLIVTTNLNVIGTNAMVQWQVRDNAAQSWAWYADGTTTRLWFSQTGDRFLVDSAGSATVYLDLTVNRNEHVLGALTVDGNGLFANGQVAIGVNGLSYFGSNQIGFTWGVDAGVNRVQVWVDRTFIGGIAVVDSNNNLTTINGVYANYVHSNGNIDANADMHCQNLYSNGIVNAPGNINAGAFNCSGQSFLGTLTSNYVSSSGDVYVGNNVNCQHEVFCTVLTFGDFNGGRNAHLYSHDGSTYLDLGYSWYLAFPASTGQVTWVVGGAFWWAGSRGSDGLMWNNIGAMGGFGAYQNLSDRRFKEDITPTKKGLAEILKLTPVEFQRIKPKPVKYAPPREIGFVAQDVEAVLPEAVRSIQLQEPDDKGLLHDIEPALGLTSDTIVACLVNAVKELHQMVQDLHSRGV